MPIVSSKQKNTVSVSQNWKIVLQCRYGLMGHFHVTLYLCFKKSPCAKSLKKRSFSYDFNGFTQRTVSMLAKGSSEMIC